MSDVKALLSLQLLLLGDLDTSVQIHSKKLKAFKAAHFSLHNIECLDSNLGATVKENKLGG